MEIQKRGDTRDGGSLGLELELDPVSIDATLPRLPLSATTPS